VNTLTEIANLALIEIQKDPIANLDVAPANPNASAPRKKVETLINTILPTVMKEVQASSNWSSLTAKETLSLISEPTTDDPVYIYAYPDGVLNEIRLVSGAPYEVHGKTLRTNDPAAILWRVRYSDNPADWNTYLKKAIYMELAARIAPSLAEDVNIIRAARANADTALVDCTAKDYSNRATPRKNDQYYDLNSARDGYGGIYDGAGRISVLRGSINPPRYP
jgi:hypothetical protein